MPSTPTVAVIGAGIAGLAAARRLHAAGIHVVLFEKSRGVGGRMATRRIDAMAFDHGAQFFTARGEIFSAYAAKWLEAGVIAQWSHAMPDARTGTRYVGTPGMTAPARALAAGLIIVTGTTVSRIARSSVDGRWRIHDGNGVLGAAAIHAFDMVVLAVPAPQARPLISESGVDLHGTERAIYAPCWALMVAAGGPVAGLADIVAPTDGPIGWIARNGSKPGRAALPESIVAHATPVWSRENLERPADEVRDLLLESLRSHAGAFEAVYAIAHRWRHALVETPAGASYLWNAAAGFGACGDWCIGGRVEAAFDSGDQLAGRILEDRQGLVLAS